MTTTLPVTIWMNTPSPYQSDLFKALVARENIDLQVIFACESSADGDNLDPRCNLDGFAHRFLDPRRPRRDAIRLVFEQRERLHVVSGIWAEPPLAAALVALQMCKGKYAIHTEAPERTTARSTARRLVREGFAKTVVRRAVGFLPVSRLANEFLADFGIEEDALYPFGYFRRQSAHASELRQMTASERSIAGGARTTTESEATEIEPKRTEVVFVGQVNHRGAPDVLLDAMLSLLPLHADLRLTVIGEGDMRLSLEERVASRKVGDQVKFDGSIGSDEIPARLAAADVLVLPSRWNAWGLIVNEAFSVGTPVIVSDTCGAADIVREGMNGYVFRHEDAADLRRCLEQFIQNRPAWHELRRNALMTGESVTAERVAPYLINCLRHMIGDNVTRPIPPWKSVEVRRNAKR